MRMACTRAPPEAALHEQVDALGRAGAALAAGEAKGAAVRVARTRQRQQRRVRARQRVAAQAKGAPGNTIQRPSFPATHGLGAGDIRPPLGAYLEYSDPKTEHLGPFRASPRSYYMSTTGFSLSAIEPI